MLEEVKCSLAHSFDVATLHLENAAEPRISVFWAIRRFNLAIG